MAQVDDALRGSLDRLVPARREEPEWDDVLKRLNRGTSEQAVRPRGQVKPLAWLMPTTGLVATLAVAVLVAVSPWSGSTSVVSKAEAAIASAAPGQVLYERAEIRRVCLPRQRHGQCGTPARIEVWVEGGAGTRHFRAITRQALPTPGRSRAEFPAWPSIVTEVGGVLGRTRVKEALAFKPPNTLVRFKKAPAAITSDSFDPVALIRHALSTGHAHATRTTTIEHHGLRVIEVRLHGVDGRPGDATYGDATYYVDRKTYAPFQIVYHHVDSLQFFSPVFDKSAPAGVTVRFLAFRRAAATPALRAHTDITRMHKGATTICGVYHGRPDC